MDGEGCARLGCHWKSSRDEGMCSRLHAANSCDQGPQFSGSARHACGVPLTPETTADPAGLTARARPKARPDGARRNTAQAITYRCDNAQNTRLDYGDVN